MDPVNCQSLSNSKPDFDLKKVEPDIVLLKQEELQYLNFVCSTVLTKKLTELNSGFSFILKFVPYKPLHENREMFEKQDVFIESLGKIIKTFCVVPGFWELSAMFITD